VLWSARAIPGNERSIGLVVNRLVDLGVSVIPPWGSDGAGLHTSGHGLREEVAEWLSWVRPRYVLPIHGEAWHLAEHRRALRRGRPDAEVLSLRSGGAVHIRKDSPPTIEPRSHAEGLSAGVGSELWGPRETALRERRRIARSGVVTVVVEGRTAAVVSVGVFSSATRALAEADLTAAVVTCLRAESPNSVEGLEERVRLTLRRAVKRHTGERVECSVRVSAPHGGK
jgi:ribonuclease J